MKKICVLLVIMFLLVVIWPASALAEGEPTPSPAPTTVPEPPIPVSLEIDNGNIYEGMGSAYKDGYTPTVQNGMATIILPLVATGEIAGNAITVTPGLGSTASSPFVYSNYQKMVPLQLNPVNGGIAMLFTYLVRFDIPLSPGRINGVYPVTIDVQARAADYSLIQQSFTCYVTITDGKDPNDAGEVEKPTSQPKIIVSGYSVNPAPAMAGEEFTVSITLKNTSETKSVQNMVVKASCDSPNFSLQNDSNTFYIGKLGKGKTTEVALTYKTDLETPPQRYNITLAIEYDNADAMTLASSGTVAVAVSQPLRVEMETPQAPSQVNAGDTLPLAFQVMNLGRSAVYNVRVELAGPGLIPSGSAFVGNMEPGTAAEAEMDVFIGTKNMTQGYEGEDKYGFTNGVITLIYEDAAGQQYTEEAEFSTTINPPVITATTEPEEEPEKAGQWWISIAIGAVVIGGLAAFLITRGKRREKGNEDR